ncbi:MAG: hypothetical protein ABIV63_03665, partial [Caldimonas sp.]
MKHQTSSTRTALRRTLVSLGLAAAFTSSFALPVFTLNPSAAGLNGTNVTADNILVSDFSTVRFTGTGSNFTEHGYLSVT